MGTFNDLSKWEIKFKCKVAVQFFTEKNQRIQKTPGLTEDLQKDMSFLSYFTGYVVMHVIYALKA